MAESAAHPHPLATRQLLSRWQRSAVWRRTLVALLLLGQTVVATYAMMTALPYNGTTWLERGILAVFALLFAWISAGFWIGVTGFVVRRLGGDRLRPSLRLATTALEHPVAPTAIVFPIFHEDVQRTLAGVRACWLDLQRTDQAAAFSFFVLSDSRDPAIWLREREACHRLSDALGGAPIHYRRRGVNLNRKTGNISDFLRRWGRNFRYMVVMDADSLMAGDTLVNMARLMEADPRIGILQTSPSIINATSGLARLQQFANRLYGPMYTEGLAALQLGDAAYWGHNAIIRVEAFMTHCGLRRLGGRGLFSGSVLSHDFVEAAYMRRAGYEVWLDAGLTGSYEETPPTLVDELERDRRWAHGNLQHLWFLFRRGFTSAHRLAFLNGIMSYLASGLWLVYLALITIELAQFTLWPIEYFPDPHSPFPTWPRWQPEWVVQLLLSTLFLLFAPKFLALIDAALTPARLRSFGGLARGFGGVLLEIVTSILLAPIRMLSHSRAIAVSVLNLGVRWAGQNRTAEVGWGRALLHHLPGSLLAFAWAVFAYWLDPLFFYWSLPVALPLVFAAPISRTLSRFSVGNRWRASGLLTTPEESRPPAVLTDLAHAPGLITCPDFDGFEVAVVHPWVNRLHVVHGRARKDTAARRSRRTELVKAALQRGPGGLSLPERNWLAQDAAGLAELHARAWMAGPESPWADSITRMCGAQNNVGAPPHA